jgi:hypothetical protein
MFLFEARISCKIADPPKHIMLKPMKQKPIIFSSEMIQAILEGRKTQTRRIVKPQPVDVSDIDDENPEVCFVQDGKLREPARYGSFEVPCKYGSIGDLLWVKESYRNVTYWQDDMGHDCIQYKADYINPKGSWTSPIYMPKSAARIWLQITNIRVERLKDITEADAIAEGVQTIDVVVYPEMNKDVRFRDYGKTKDDPIGNFFETAFASFFTLFGSINGKKAVMDDPWVWVIEFKRFDKPSDIIHL